MIKVNVTVENKYIRATLPGGVKIGMTVPRPVLIHMTSGVGAALTLYDAEIKAWVEQKIQEAVQPPEKPIINCTAVADIEDVDDPQEEAYYFVPPLDGSTNPDAENGTLYRYIDGGMELIPGEEGIMYMVTLTDGTVRMYAFNGQKFVDMSGEVSDNTIYTDDLNELISKELDKGIYNVISNEQLLVDSYWQLINGWESGKTTGPTSRQTLADILGISASEASTILNNARLSRLTSPVPLHGATEQQINLLKACGANVELHNEYRTVVNTYSLSVGDERFLSNRDGWAAPFNGAWIWSHYSYDGHHHVADDITDIDERIQSFIQPEKKEVIECIPISDPSEVTTVIEGQYYIDLEGNKLYVGIEDAIQEVEPTSDVLYLVNQDNVSLMYVWDATNREFHDVSGKKIDDTIYVTNLDEDLDEYREEGVFNVCYMNSYSGMGLTAPSIFYTMKVSRSIAAYTRPPLRRVVSVITQLLLDEKGYMVRTKTITNDVEEEWTDWEDFTYASKKDIEDTQALIFALT